MTFPGRIISTSASSARRSALPLLHLRSDGRSGPSTRSWSRLRGRRAARHANRCATCRGDLAAQLYAGLAAAATGLAIDNKVLIIAGSLDGTSGFFLSILMSRAMNRSFANVLFGAVARRRRDKVVETRTVTRYTAEDMKFVLENASRSSSCPARHGGRAAQPCCTRS